MQPDEAAAETSPTGSNDITLEKQNRSGVITLNRSKALNALSQDMINQMEAFYVDCVEDPHIYGIVVKSNLDNAFSAGGDLRQTYSLLGQSVEEAARYFSDEYQHNWTLERFTKPTLPFLNGIVFGGGAGISLYGTHQIAGENFSFAMPETKIGMFPDIGSSFFLSRLPNAVGTYLALTGYSIGPSDAVKLGLVTHYIRSEHYDDIAAAMVEADPIDPILEDLNEDPGEGELASLTPWIEQCFSASTVEEILLNLENLPEDAIEWGAQTAADLRERSPLALKITHRNLTEAGGDKTLDETLKRDFRIVWRMLEHGEFKEGIRALIIDKDKKPNWAHADVSEISDEEVDAFFQSLGENELKLVDHAKSP